MNHTRKVVNHMNMSKVIGGSEYERINIHCPMTQTRIDVVVHKACHILTDSYMNMIKQHQSKHLSHDRFVKN